jgi:hypothetical protein
MSQVRGNTVNTSTYAPTGQVYSSTLNYRGDPNRDYVQPGSYSKETGYTTTYEYQGVPQYAVQGSGYVQGGSQQRVAATDIPVESRIEYIPFEKKYVEYEQVEKVYQVPVEYEETEYEEVVRNERVPYERTITDYYAVETQVEYIRREVEETIMVEEPVERTYDRVQYIPVETQIVHYPERDNYQPAPTRTRVENLGILPNGYRAEEYRGGEIRGGEVRREEYRGNEYAVPVSGGQYQRTTYATGSGVGGATYVTGGSNVNVSSTAYQTQGGYAPTATTTYVAPGASTTYQTGYVTGGSGVRQGGYVTGGSGVRGSGVRNDKPIY